MDRGWCTIELFRGESYLCDLMWSGQIFPEVICRENGIYDGGLSGRKRQNGEKNSLFA